MENVRSQHKTCDDPNPFASYSGLGKDNFGVGHVSLRSVIVIHVLYKHLNHTKYRREAQSGIGIVGLLLFRLQGSPEARFAWTLFFSYFSARRGV